MGLDQTLQTKSEIIVEWRKEYWIDDFFMKLLSKNNEDGRYLLSSEDIISLKRFCELCLQNPKMKQIVSKETISDIILIRTISSINVFINSHNLKDYEIYYTQSF